jgi:predicted PurR-regulated permease PerM
MKIPFLFKLVINRFFFEKLAALLLLGILLYALSSFLLIFLFTFLFAFLFLDLAKWIQKKITLFQEKIESKPLNTGLMYLKKFPVVISIIYIFFLTVIATMFYSFIPHLIEETKGLVKLAPQITNQLRSAADSVQSQVSFNLGFDAFFEGMVSKANVETTVVSIFQNLKNAGVFILQMVIALILSFVFLIDREKINHYFSGIKLGNFAFIYEQFSNFAEKITK